MSKRKHWIRILLSIVLLALVATACNGTDAEKAPDSSDSSPGASGDTMTIGIALDIGDLNPHLYVSKMFAQDMVYDGLLAFRDGEVVPALAESWEVSDDGTEITFHLRSGVKFSDGSDFSSANVVQNFDAVRANLNSHTWLGLLNHIVDYSAPDESTFVVQLDEAYYPALQEFTHIRPLRILAPAGFPDSGDTVDGIKAPIGTGPWVLQEHRVNEYAIFERNEHYWGEAPKLSGVKLHIIPNSDTSTASLEAGEVDIILDFNQSSSMTVDQFQYLQGAGFQTKVSNPMLTRMILMNTGNQTLEDLAVRQAMLYALNRGAMVESVFGGLEPVADAMFSSNMPYCDIEYETSYGYDADKAAALLDEAGWTLPAGKTVREKGGQPLSLTLYYDGEDAAMRTIGQVMQSDYAKVGIELKLQGEENQTSKDRWQSGEFDLLFYQSWGAPYDPHSTLGTMNEGGNNVLYHTRKGIPGSQDTYQQFQSIITSTDEDLRVAGFTELLNTLHNEAFYIPISFVTNRAAYADNVDGVDFNIAFDISLNTLCFK